MDKGWAMRRSQLKGSSCDHQSSSVFGMGDVESPKSCPARSRCSQTWRSGGGEGGSGGGREAGGPPGRAAGRDRQGGPLGGGVGEPEETSDRARPGCTSLMM